MKLGLVLEGGAMRGMFTAGVLDVMMEEGLTDFDGAIGVSAGACFGCNIKSLQHGRTVRYNLRFCRDWRYASFRSLFETGDLYGADFCYDQIPFRLDPFDVQTFSKNPMKFYCVCTDLETGRPVYKRIHTGEGEEMQWIRASASMPLVSRPVEIGGRLLMDGGISDSVPLRAFERKGYERNVVVLTQPEDYVKKPQKSMPLLRLALRAYPETVRDLETRYIRYNRASAYIKSQEEAGRVFVIRPEAPLEISSVEHDPAELVRVYELGRAVMKKRLEGLEEFMGRDRA